MTNHLRWTSTLLHALYGQGVRYAVISPGSRSTPLTIASALHPGIQSKVVLDERSAAFMALGIGKNTGKPAVLICTSGTAAANYFPAVVEAKESGVPLIILTADRPPNLRGIGSSQTVDQLKLYGDQAVFFHEAGEPSHEEPDLKRLKYLARQAVEESITRGGAAHINMPFRKPLEPSAEQIEEAKKRYASEADKAIINSSRAVIHPDQQIIQKLAGCKKPLIIAGPADPYRSLDQQAQRLAEKLHAPLIAEPGSGISDIRFCMNRYEQFLRNEDFLKKNEPDFIIRFGDQPFTKSLLTALEHWGTVPTLHITSRGGWQDHGMSAVYRIFCGKNDGFDFSELKAAASGSWFETWQKADQKSETTLQDVLFPGDTLTDGHVFHHLNNSLSGDWNVMISNSFPPRDMALFGGTQPGQFVNRGAAGIDGILSTALGIHFSSANPTCCILGDLAFLHDSNALLSLKYSGKPFAIVVVNNGGGNIFRMLPVYQQKQLYETYFETPQQVDIQSIAEAHGILYRGISMIAELNWICFSELSDPVIFECITDADRSMELRKKLWAG